MQTSEPFTFRSGPGPLALFLILGLPAFAAVAQENQPAPDLAPLVAVALDSPSAAVAPTTATTIFSGQAHRLEWALRSKSDQSGELQLFLYRVLASTAVPIEEGKILVPEFRISPGSISLATYDFAAPESDRPVRYFARLSFVSGGIATSVAKQSILAIPAGFLGQYTGAAILLQGFPDEDTSVRNFLKSQGWTVSATALENDEAEVGLVAYAPDTAPPPLDGNKVVVYRDFSRLDTASDAVVTLVGRNQTGQLVRWEIPETDWETLPTSATQQNRLHRMIEILLRKR